MEFFSRKPTRIPGYDYSRQNYYFITICTYEKKCIFGSIRNKNHWGQIAENELKNLENHFQNIRIDNCIVMPNHIHAIIAIDGTDNIGLDRIIGLYKSGVTRKIHQEQPDIKVWQRSFHDHIIRNQREYEQIWQYVQYNNQKWEEDCFYPKKVEC